MQRNSKKRKRLASMESVFIYTFSSFPYIEQLSKLSDEVFVFSNKLREDLTVLKEQLEDEQPTHILGIAMYRGKSRYEPITVNHFHKGVVIKGQPEQLSLYVPDAAHRLFSVAKRPSNTFCNWTMYHIQTHINEQGYNTKLSFLHLNPKDINILLEQFRY